MNSSTVYKRLEDIKAEGRKAIAVLIDPDKTNQSTCISLLNICNEQKVDFIFVGGSLITDDSLSKVVGWVKQGTNIPVVLFPGSSMHIDAQADAILFLSLISGRNPDLLIGQQVLAAPILKKSGLEILSTGYILIDGGTVTTVSYISNTTPIPNDKPSIAACTALAGEMLGLKLTYLDAGSGAHLPVSPKLIQQVRKNIDTPLIVGGGINSVQRAKDAWDAGADLIVVGNSIENNPDLLAQIVAIR